MSLGILWPVVHLGKFRKGGGDGNTFLDPEIEMGKTRRNPQLDLILYIFKNPTIKSS